MRLQYFENTDSLYIHLSDTKSADSEEVHDGIVLDYGPDGELVGIDIDHASHHVNLAEWAFTRVEAKAA